MIEKYIQFFYLIDVSMMFILQDIKAGYGEVKVLSRTKEGNYIAKETKKKVSLKKICQYDLNW